MSTFTPKPVEFKFGEYFNKGFELFKKDMGTFILAFIFVLIMSLIPFCGFLGIGKGTPPTLDKFIEIVTDETGDPLDESIARAIYAIFQRYLNDSGNTTKSPTWAVEAMLNNTSSPEGGTRLNPKTPTEFASFLGQELTINMMSDAINGINK